METVSKEKLIRRIVEERDEYPERSPMFHRFDLLLKEVIDGQLDENPKPLRCVFTVPLRDLDRVE